MKEGRTGEAHCVDVCAQIRGKRSHGRVKEEVNEGRARAAGGAEESGESEAEKEES